MKPIQLLNYIFVFFINKMQLLLLCGKAVSVELFCFYIDSNAWQLATADRPPDGFEVFGVGSGVTNS